MQEIQKWNKGIKFSLLYQNVNILVYIGLKCLTGDIPKIIPSYLPPRTFHLVGGTGSPPHNK